MIKASLPIKKEHSGLIWEFGPTFVAGFVLFLSMWRPNYMDYALVSFFGEAQSKSFSTATFVTSLLLVIFCIATFAYAIFGTRKAEGWFKLVPAFAFPLLLWSAYFLFWSFILRDLSLESWHF